MSDCHPNPHSRHFISSIRPTPCLVGLKHAEQWSFGEGGWRVGWGEEKGSTAEMVFHEWLKREHLFPLGIYIKQCSEYCRLGKKKKWLLLCKQENPCLPLERLCTSPKCHSPALLWSLTRHSPVSEQLQRNNSSHFCSAQHPLIKSALQTFMH